MEFGLNQLTVKSLERGIDFHPAQHSIASLTQPRSRSSSASAIHHITRCCRPQGNTSTTMPRPSSQHVCQRYCIGLEYSFILHSLLPVVIRVRPIVTSCSLCHLGVCGQFSHCHPGPEPSSDHYSLGSCGLFRSLPTLLQKISFRQCLWLFIFIIYSTRSSRFWRCLTTAEA